MAQNTNFFHGMANFRRKVNYIWRIRINDTMVEDFDDINQGIIVYYKNMFMESIQSRPFPCNYGTKHLRSSESASLEEPFTEKEIRDCLANYDGSKAPSPDGFSFKFFKKCRGIVRHDILEAFREFHDSGSLPNCATHSFICLVPKKDATEEIKDLRPISLMGSVNKLICKVLSKRLGHVLSSVVSEFQQASVQGKQISEAGLLANELVDSRRTSRKPSLMLKLDIEKAFDNVNWSCLFKVLARLGFGER
ncbi:unnamed protein product [Linum trigynum]|uniref:Reverse transcriptase domain-containing protein n=1 Tax=Linum trigynum TaxID=586398 RepID=A0AAV2CWD1_9ROSI